MADMTATQQLTLGPVTATDRLGNPAAFDGAPTFVSSDPAVASVSPVDGDPNSALIVAHGVGAAQIRVTIDADLGAGVETVEGFVGINVTPAHAVNLTVPTGTPVEQP